MTNNVTVVDYGVGNLLSVSRAIEHVGSDVEITSDVSAIKAANRLILPGVGAFSHGVGELRNRGLFAAVQEFAETGRPFLGICLGMQMMLDASQEFGQCDGLGMVSGKVVVIPATGKDGTAHKIPHIGWNELIRPAHQSWDDTILEDVEPGASFYFVHSYMANPERPENLIAHCGYNGLSLAAVIQSELPVGVQ